MCLQVSTQEIQTLLQNQINQINNHDQTPSRSFLPFVRWDVDTICKVVTLRNYFHLLRTEVNNITPRLEQKRLQVPFQDYMAKIVIIGRVERINSQCNDIIYTRKIKNLVLKILLHTNSWWVPKIFFTTLYLWRSSCLMVFRCSREWSSWTNLNNSTWLLCSGWFTTNR